MEKISLNLARKWRSIQFQEIVGQDLVVRILQNSLFKNQFFPVYLLSGQRGCGKTSTARVFATAVNCTALPDFQKNPKTSVPCLECSSCMAMKKGQHPDFIEIDAASYTGVDNIRNIIDTSSFLPVLGSKKIYLIDEVHMLSKAAFNALLKLLEEPPKSVVFILATTEAQKLPDTVRSRCFQLLFNPIEETCIVEHLRHICTQESIAYEDAGLETIAQVTQGSLRDALNLLEQARFAESKVTKSVVLAVLGHIDDQVLYQLLSGVMRQDQQAVIRLMHDFGTKSVSSDYILKRLLELLYDCIVIKYGGTAKYSLDIQTALDSELQAVTVQNLILWLDQLAQLDIVLAKTSKKQLLLETALIRVSAGEYQNRSVVDDQKKK